MADLMASCWSATPAERPRFKQIAEDIATILRTEHDFEEGSRSGENSLLT